MKAARKLLRLFRNDKRPLRRLASRALVRLPFDPARFVRIRVRDYQIYLHRCTLAAELWYDANSRCVDAEFLKAYLNEADTYLDIGANIGTTVIPAAMKVTTGQVIAFEPHPRTFSYLQQNLQLNGISHVDVRNCALGSESGWISFTDHLADDQNHPTQEENALRVKVEVLDDVTRHLERIALIKLDVEGYEKHVIDGGPQTLRKTECLYFELSEQQSQRFGNRNADLLAALEEHGFRLFRKTAERELEPLRRTYRQTAHHENAIAVRDVDAFLQRTGWSIAAVSAAA